MAARRSFACAETTVIATDRVECPATTVTYPCYNMERSKRPSHNPLKRGNTWNRTRLRRRVAGVCALGRNDYHARVWGFSNGTARARWGEASREIGGQLLCAFRQVKGNSVHARLEGHIVRAATEDIQHHGASLTSWRRKSASARWNGSPWAHHSGKILIARGV